MEGQLTNKKNSFEVMQIVKEAWELNNLRGVKPGIWKIIVISAIAISILKILLAIIFGIIGIVIGIFIKSTIVTTSFSVLQYSIVLFVQIAFAAMIVECCTNVLKQKDNAINNFISFYNWDHRLNKNVILTYVGLFAALVFLFTGIVIIAMPSTSVMVHNIPITNQDPKNFLYLIPLFLVVFLCANIIIPLIMGVILPFSMIRAYENNAETHEETLEIIKETFCVVMKHFLQYIMLYIIVVFSYMIPLLAVGLACFIISYILSLFSSSSVIIYLPTIFLGLISLITIITYVVPFMSNILAVAYTKENFDNNMEDDFLEQYKW